MVELLWRLLIKTFLKQPMNRLITSSNNNLISNETIASVCSCHSAALFQSMFVSSCFPNPIRITTHCGSYNGSVFERHHPPTHQHEFFVKTQ